MALAAAVQLGQCVQYHWKYHSVEQAERISVSGFKYIVLSEQDKEAVRQQIIVKMYECQNKAIVKQLIRSVQTIALLDYPDKWGSLQEHIASALRSENERGILAGLQALFCLAKKYEYELGPEREPLFAIMSAFQGDLGSIAEKALASAAENEAAQAILVQVIKVFYTANQLFLCPHVKEMGLLQSWMGLFKTVLDMAVPAALDSPTEDPDEVAARDKSTYWKMKAQAARMAFRLFSKYANLKYVKNDEQELAFCTAFQQTFAEPLLESTLQLLFRTGTNFLGSKTLNFVIKLVSSASKIDVTMAKMVPFVDKIMYEKLVPLMMVTAKDQQLFTDDPIEFIRRQNDIMETVYQPRNSAIDLLQYLCQHKAAGAGRKAKPEYLVPFLTFASKNMADFKAAMAGGVAADWRIEEALLFAVGHLQEQIGLYKDLKASIEPMLKEHVLPLLSAGQPMLQSRACWMYGEYADFKIGEDDHVRAATDGIYQCLYSAHLPVRFQAGLALAKMLVNDVASEALKPHLQQVLEVYLKAMEDIDSEEIIDALERIMEQYADEMGPYAVQIATQLVKKYQAMVTEDPNAEDDDEEEQILAATKCVTAIRRILEAVHKDKATMMEIMRIIYPVMMYSLTPDGLDSIDDGLDCINTCIYYGCSPDTRVPIELWKLLPQMMHITAGADNDVDGGFAFEQLALVANCLSNFIAKDPVTLMTVGPDQTETYFALAVKFVQRVLVVNANGEHKQDGITALRILIALFETLPAQIDGAALAHIVGMLLAELKVSFEQNHPKTYKSMLLQALAMAFYNSSKDAFRIIESEGQTVAVFTNWLAFMPKFKLEFEIRRILFGLIAILKTPTAEMPPLVVEQLPVIVKHVASLTGRVHGERLKTLEENEKYIAKGFKDSDDEGSDIDDDEDPEEVLNNIQGKKFKAGKPQDIDDVSDDDDEDYEPDFEDAAGEYALYDSPLEKVDELILTKETLDQIYQADQAAYAQYTSQLPEEDKAKFLQTLGEAEGLKSREEACRKAYDENDLAKKV